jgi:hypothetical protein
MCSNATYRVAKLVGRMPAFFRDATVRDRLLKVQKQVGSGMRGFEEMLDRAATPIHLFRHCATLAHVPLRLAK